MIVSISVVLGATNPLRTGIIKLEKLDFWFFKSKKLDRFTVIVVDVDFS